mgnify:CR=1 FL=1
MVVVLPAPFGPSKPKNSPRDDFERNPVERFDLDALCDPSGVKVFLQIAELRLLFPWK